MGFSTVHVHIYIYIYTYMSIDLKVLVWELCKTVLTCKVVCPRKIRGGSAKGKQYSAKVVDLGRIGLVRYMLYQSVGIQVSSSLSRHAAKYFCEIIVGLALKIR